MLYSHPNASNSSHVAACHPLVDWWKPSGGGACCSWLLPPIRDRRWQRHLPLIALVGEVSPCDSDDEHCQHDPDEHLAQSEQQVRGQRGQLMRHVPCFFASCCSFIGLSKHPFGLIWASVTGRAGACPPTRKYTHQLRFSTG